MGHPPDEQLTRQLAREISDREGVKATVGGLSGHLKSTLRLRIVVCGRWRLFRSNDEVEPEKLLMLTLCTQPRGGRLPSKGGFPRV